MKSMPMNPRGRPACSRRAYQLAHPGVIRVLFYLALIGQSTMRVVSYSVHFWQYLCVA